MYWGMQELMKARRTYDEESFNKNCSIPQKEFFWLDALHPTPPIHDAMAADIAEQLRSSKFVGGNASDSSIPLATGGSSLVAPGPLTTSVTWVVLYTCMFWWGLNLF